MKFDLALILVIGTVVSGAIWLLDAVVFAPRRKSNALGDDRGGATASEPVVVDYARTFFPVLLLVLLVRSFLFEPFRIPSASMVPTLLVGDFIFVNKYAYGLRLPVLNSKVLEVGGPKRGDVVVFRLPKDPSTNYIKRVVGLPGDRVVYRGGVLTVNGEKVPLGPASPYEGKGQDNADLLQETLGEVTHPVLHLKRDGRREGEYVVPEKHYFMMGDNRDNSQDSRFPAVGFVPEDKLVGRAVRIWMTMDVGNLGRIGDAIK